MLMSRGIRKLLGITLNLRKLAPCVNCRAHKRSISSAVALHDTRKYVAILVIGAIEQIAVYPAILAFTGAARKEELKVLRDITGKIPIMGSIIRVFAGYAGLFIRA